MQSVILNLDKVYNIVYIIIIHTRVVTTRITESRTKENEYIANNISTEEEKAFKIKIGWIRF